MLVGFKPAFALLAQADTLSMQEFAAIALAAAVLPALVVGLVMRSRARRQQQAATDLLEKQRAEGASALKSEQARAADAATQAEKEAKAAAAAYEDLQQRFNTQREVAERRANDASQRITQLEAELATTREVAAQVQPAQVRIKDLEQVLTAEQGRVKALEQAVEATNARATDFEKRMISAQELVLKHQEEVRERSAELKKIQDEQAAYAAAGGVEAELVKAREAQQQAESKIANLQRALKAAEARVEMVQKEFMSAVGMTSAASAPAAQSSGGDKKLRELEEKLAQVEAEARRRAREDGYKIAELEYRLSEAREKPGEGTPPPSGS